MMPMRWPMPDGFGEIVGDEDGGLSHLARQRDEVVLKLAADQGIKGAERLVHQQDFGIAGKRPGKADALLHAAGQLLRPGPAHSDSCTCSSFRRAVAIRSSRGRLRSSRPRATLSITLRCGSSAKFWNTMPIFSDLSLRMARCDLRPMSSP